MRSENSYTSATWRKWLFRIVLVIIGVPAVVLVCCAAFWLLVYFNGDPMFGR
jgi:hypothetical protein